MDALEAVQLHCMAVEHFEEGQRMMAKIRYSHAGEDCTVTEVSADGSSICLQFDRPVRAVTPGQAVVFYEDGYVLGGGTIV